ncbi:MAG TPA: class I SAM-dependent DNA methyltransferase [Solirubrobacteraceae bacterium]|nr:class I SAM-dependent DNA methyltransferase [Solirubrobacteraceae bacterium]
MSNEHMSDLPDPAALWKSADLLRGSVDAAEYKHLVLGLLFLKYVSESFEQHREQLERELSDPASPDYIKNEIERQAQIEDRDEYQGDKVFFVPAGARWSNESEDPEQLGLLQTAALPGLGQRIDNALDLIEKENPETLKGVLPKIYARAPLSSEKLGSLVETIGNIPFQSSRQALDYLGRAYEYFIGRFASAEGKGAGEFYTPQSVTQLLVEMLEPYSGRIFDPACGSCGLFIQSARFLEPHGKSPDQLAIYGQEMNQATWRLGQMNLAIHGLAGQGQIAYTENGSLLDDAFPTLKMDFVLANPPFNQDPWGAAAVKDDVRWKYGVPPDANANYAWMQHMLHHLAPNGRAGFVMANGSMTSNTNNEGVIRRGLIEDDAVDCVVALPSGLFFSTGIPVCMWFFDRDKASSGERDRRGETLFIDARHMGEAISRKQKRLTEAEIAEVARTYHAWRGQTEAGEYQDVLGFCVSSTIEEIEAEDWVVAPGRYVGAPEEEEDQAAFEERITSLVEGLAADFARAEDLTAQVRQALGAVGYDL